MAFQCDRWTLANLLPVGFVLFVIGAIYAIYVYFHLLHLLEIRQYVPPGHTFQPDEVLFQKGLVHAGVSHFLVLMLFFCFGQAVFTDPGSVPATADWMPELDKLPSASRTPSGNAPTPASQYELKTSGQPRFCKWCNCFKPDRTHHCRVCRSCILRMDHHCPWIANCVGFHNHKSFLLLVMYALLSCMYISVTFYDTLHRTLNEETTIDRRFMVVFGMTLSVMMGSVLGLFFLLHVWLMMKATTTIEFCEKTYKTSAAAESTANPDMSIYDLGGLHNIKAVLGPNPLLWFLPCSTVDGDGLQFQVNVFGTRSTVPLHYPSLKEKATDAVAFVDTAEITGTKASNS
eukprot:TRINITY_DN33597_c0_g1_i2.p1 TRINITY_DN33597_c0_g1~~TRINITY_DN33597_c0_g1_i2.p1  ORF type:complete len:345 (-),score=68.19 TRINITY_DN33597_c0_g1_i2:96-1130(-)